MVDEVVIVGTRRSGRPVSQSELRQMAGRAGRDRSRPSAIVHMVCDAGDEGFARDAVESSGEVVRSGMDEVEVAVFHVLPEITSKRVRDEESFDRWFAMTLGAFQGEELVAGDVLDRLLELGAVEVNGGSVVATELGAVSTSLYFHPADVRAWLDNFSELFACGREDSVVATAWALGRLPFWRPSGMLSDGLSRLLEEEIPAGCGYEADEALAIGAWWSCMGGPSDRTTRPTRDLLRRGVGRTLSALRRLDEVAEWGRGAFFCDLGTMIRRGVDRQMVSVLELPGVNKGMASRLRELGAETVDEVLAMMEDDSEEGGQGGEM